MTDGETENERVDGMEEGGRRREKGGWRNGEQKRESNEGRK